jgi:glycyl-tRNA synthetase beta chain
MPDFLLELRSEEIPARMQAKAEADLARLFAEQLGAAGLYSQGIQTYATPRRLALIARGLPERPAVREETKGPAQLRAAAGARRLSCARPGSPATSSRSATASSSRSPRSPAAPPPRSSPPPSRHRPRLSLAQVDALGRRLRSTDSPRWVRPLQGIVACSARTSCPSRSPA